MAAMAEVNSSHAERATGSELRVTLPMLHQMRVCRTYGPGQKGARRLAQKYGRQLVCVRHRVNAGETRRYTTVELVVDSLPITRQASALVSLRIPFGDQSLRSILIACGAKWRPATQTWTLPRIVARRLRLMRYARGAEEPVR